MNDYSITEERLRELKYRTYAGYGNYETAKEIEELESLLRAIERARGYTRLQGMATIVMTIILLLTSVLLLWMSFSR